MMRAFLLLLLSLVSAPVAAYAQATGVNPPVGSIWTYLGATYGAAWMPASIGSMRASAVACDGTTDVTNQMQADLNSYSTAGGGTYLAPLGKRCVVGGSANLVLPYNVQILCSENGGGFWPSGNFTATADFLLDPSHSITSASPSAGGNGGRSGIYGCSIIQKNLPAVTSLRTSIAAAGTFAGTGFICNATQTDVELIGNLFIGFTTAVQSSCDRFNFIRNRGDAVNFFSLLQCNETCIITDDESWPFVGNPYQGFPQSQTTNVTSATIAGGTTLTLGFAAPPTPFVTGDTVAVGAVGGVTGAQYGRFTATVVDSTHISVTGTFSGAYTSGGTIYLSAMKRTGTGFLLVGTGGGPFVSGLVDYGHDTGLHYQNGSATRCSRCWIDNDTNLNNRDPVPVGLLLDGGSPGLVNEFDGFINATGVALVKNDASILTVGPGTQLYSLNSVVGSYVIRALAGSIVFNAANAFTDGGAGPGAVIYIGTAVTNIAVNGGGLNGSTTFQSANPPCNILVTNGVSGPCTYLPTYTGAAIAGTPLQSLYWVGVNGMIVFYYQDNGHAITGKTGTGFSISLPTTVNWGGSCMLGNMNATMSAGITQFAVYIVGGTSAAQFNQIGTGLNEVLPGTNLPATDVITMTCIYG